MDNEQLTREIMALRQEQAGISEQMKAAFKRIDEQKALTETVYELASSMKVMTSQMEQLTQEQARMRMDVDVIRLKPASRWESLVGQVITLIVAAVLGGIISKVI